VAAGAAAIQRNASDAMEIVNAIEKIEKVEEIDAIDAIGAEYRFSFYASGSWVHLCEYLPIMQSRA